MEHVSNVCKDFIGIRIMCVRVADVWGIRMCMFVWSVGKGLSLIQLDCANCLKIISMQIVQRECITTNNQISANRYSLPTVKTFKHKTTLSILVYSAYKDTILIKGIVTH